MRVDKNVILGWKKAWILKKRLEAAKSGKETIAGKENIGSHQPVSSPLQENAGDTPLMQSPASPILEYQEDIDFDGQDSMARSPDRYSSSEDREVRETTTIREEVHPLAQGAQVTQDASDAQNAQNASDAFDTQDPYERSLVPAVQPTQKLSLVPELHAEEEQSGILIEEDIPLPSIEEMKDILRSQKIPGSRVMRDEEAIMKDIPPFHPSLFPDLVHSDQPISRDWRPIPESADLDLSLVIAHPYILKDAWYEPDVDVCED